MTALTTLKEPLIKSFGWLNLKDLARARGTCKAFRTLAEAAFDRYLRAKTDMEDESMMDAGNFTKGNITQILNRMPQLRYLGIRNPILEKYPDVILQALASTRIMQLKKLYLSPMDENVTDDVVSGIGARCSNLTDLSLHWCTQLTDVGTAPMVRLTQLRRVSFLRSDNISTLTLRMLARLPALTEVCLNGCRDVTPEGMSALLASQTLTSLDVGYDCSGDYHGQSALADAIAEHGQRLIVLRMTRAYYRADKLVHIATKCEQLVSMNLTAHNVEFIRDPKALTEELQKVRPGLEVIFDRH